MASAIVREKRDTSHFAESGVMAEDQVAVSSFDFARGCFQAENNMAVVGEKVWGSEVKPLLKYFYLRYLG